MDTIRIGLDFGTHQTKICIQRTPDEGHGEPNYEFFKFEDEDGASNYFLPSIVQINDDNTLSYGFVNSSSEKKSLPKPKRKKIKVEGLDVKIADKAKSLFKEYKTNDNAIGDITIISKMLELRKHKLEDLQNTLQKQEEERYLQALAEYKRECNVFRYFKQATFTDSEWDCKIDCKLLSIWYISYVIFLLEEEFGTNFSINMGVPADEKTYDDKKKLAVEILSSAYYLVEEVYENDMDSFLSDTYNQLLAKTEYKTYSEDDKEEYLINVFPEAYAGLVCFTSRGKLASGMSLMADIGGGTTDVSFFTIQENLPVIYRYWSIPKGLNFIAERSGFVYSDGDFNDMVDDQAVDYFNNKKQEIIRNLIKDLVRQLQKETSIPVTRLYDALRNRIIVYIGGGSTYDFLSTPILDFKDVHIVDSSLWKEENLRDKNSVNELCQLLTTSYGLSICDSDQMVKLSKFTTLFQGIHNESESSNNFVGKECC